MPARQLVPSISAASERALLEPTPASSVQRVFGAKLTSRSVLRPLSSSASVAIAMLKRGDSPYAAEDIAANAQAAAIQELRLLITPPLSKVFSLTKVNTLNPTREILRGYGKNC